MPFQSEKQRRYLWANEPKIARDWADTYGSRIKKDDGGIMRVGLKKGSWSPGVAAEERAAAKDVAKAAANTWNERNPQPYEDKIVRDHREKKEIRTKQQDTDHGQFFKDKPVVEKPTIGMRIDDFRNKSYQSGLNKNKVLAMRKMSLLSPVAKNVWGALIQGLGGQVPEWAQDLTEDELIAMASDVQGIKDYGQATYNPNLNPAKKGSGVELLGRVSEGQDILDRKNMTQEEWDRLFPTGNVNQGGDGGGYMGYPSYEAWLAAQGSQGTGATAATTVAPISDFQKSLTGTVDTPGYYVGNDPTASNLAWGKQFGADPRTMGQTSFAAHGGRIPAAFGGIMDSSTGRRGYFLGSIGNIFGSVAKAAKKVFKSDLGKAAMLGVGIYGANQGWFGSGSGWFGRDGTLAPLFRKKLTEEAAKKAGTAYGGASLAKLGVLTAPLLAATKLGDVPDDVTEDFDHDLLKKQYADEILRIKKESKERALDPNEWNYLGVPEGELPFKDGGRTGYYAGGQSTPSDYTMEDAMMTTTQDKLGGITDVMKQADLNRQGSVGQFYAANGGSADAKLLARVQELQDEGLDYNSAMAQALKELSKGKAQGGRIGYGGGTDLRNKMSKLLIKLANGTITDEEIIELRNIESASGFSTAQGKAQGGRIGADEGGLMDLGGMEKDYRNDGGFVPLGGEEKADDVPARLSKNEFVFTADAVRGAGGGDIDKGAEIMENIMKNLEQGGQISEETQGLTGAQEMFSVSERLSEVV